MPAGVHFLTIMVHLVTQNFFSVRQHLEAKGRIVMNAWANGVSQSIHASSMPELADWAHKSLQSTDLSANHKSNAAPSIRNLNNIGELWLQMKNLRQNLGGFM